MRRRCWPLLLLALLPQCWSFVWHDKSGAVLKSVSILVGVLIVLLWECFCTVFLSATPTIITQLFGRKASVAPLPHRNTVGSLLSSKSREFTSLSGEAWAQRALQEEDSIATGPDAFVPKAQGSVVFFASHTVTATAAQGVAKVYLMRVGDLSRELSVEVQTVDGTALAGQKYVPCRRAVVFEAQQSAVAFEVELLSHFAATTSFFVLHVASVGPTATLGGSLFCRIRLMPTGRWPENAPDLEKDGDSQWSHLKLVMAFARGLLRRRGRVLWHYILALVWLSVHKVVINTLLLNYALYDFCLTSTQVAVAIQRLPLIALAKLCLVCVDRMAEHVRNTSGGAGGCVSYLQQVLIHRYLQMPNDSVDMGKFLHLLSETAPDSVANGYTTVYQILDCSLTMALSVLMALVVPMLKGGELSFAALQPMIWILVPLYFTFFTGFWLRRHEFKRRARAAAKAQIEKNETMIDVLACRHWMRAYDSAYPVQHVRKAFDEACALTGKMKGGFGVFTLDSQQIATYSGELTKIFGILFGGYATLETLQTGSGDFTLGRFTVFLSLYGIIINAMYTLMKSWDGLVYASMLVEELSDFINEPDRFSHKVEEAKIEVEKHPLMTGSFNIKLSSMDFHLGTAPQEKDCLAVPLGAAYGVKTYNDASMLRKRICEVLGGVRACAKDDLVSCARHLLLAPPVSLVTGNILDNLLANAAAWVRAGDVQALLALLGIPIPAADGTTAAPTTKKLWELLGQSKELPDELEVESHSSWFKECCEKCGFNLLSVAEDAEDVMQPAEQHLFDIARAILADPEVIVIHDMLSAIPLPLARNAVHVLLLWQRLGGLKGLVLAFESKLPKLPAGYPDWLSVAGEIPRTLFISESSVVNAGLELGRDLDSYLALLEGGALDLEASAFKRQGSIFGGLL